MIKLEALLCGGEFQLSVLCLAPEVLLGNLSTRKWAIVKVEALLRGPESYFVVPA